MTSSRLLRATTFAVIVAGIAVVCGLAVLVDARTGVTVLAAFLAVGALLRAVAPESVIPGARSRGFDVAFLLALAVALGYLSPWGNATVAPGV
ncbi:DUF3017 domain-containing protein [Georgenia sp. TF02-10]|uniref:DUF3017 domain-containing protein n=1 Tax=Georgenia sp. TF02-10 TaxID=2917725 RepID=UPI001FA715B2|nr:DUF3017 domain-containing protein [Georgenia sp. TF02-10]UNX54262.1 DUF3017 domain-containing protein [Georgenia sp. TF02-10]